MYTCQRRRLDHLSNKKITDLGALSDVVFQGCRSEP
jgi:hypothetical protein